MVEVSDMRTTIDQNWLKRISLQFISERDYQRIEKHSVRLQFRRGEIIVKQSSQPTHIVFLEKGTVKFNYENEAGKNLILTVVSAPKILGGANLFYKDNNLFSFVALDDCTVTMIDAGIIFGLMQDNARFAMMLFQVASEMFKKAVLNFISLASKHKEGRIADVILYISSEVCHKTQFRLPLTRKEVAEFAGCSVENVIMTLSRWHVDQIIEIDGKNIALLDIERLKLISRVA